MDVGRPSLLLIKIEVEPLMFGSFVKSWRSLADSTPIHRTKYCTRLGDGPEANGGRTFPND
jgi:hypothetical protein